MHDSVLVREPQSQTIVKRAIEILALVMLFYSIAGTPPPGINEAHYLVKARNYWQPSFLDHDLFVASGKAHVVFYATIGSLTQWYMLPTVAWIGRFLGWLLIAFGLQRLCWNLFEIPFASLAVAVVWIVGVQSANLAGEWVIGGVEAKVFAYGLVLVGLSQMVVGRWKSTWILLGAAAAFHVLVGGWSVVAAGGVRIFGLLRSLFRGDQADSAKPGTSELVCLLVGGALSLFGLLPGLQMSSGTTELERHMAAQIYTFGRIRHHLAPASFPAIWFIRHFVLVAVTLAAGTLLLKRVDINTNHRLRRFCGFCTVALLLAVIGILLGFLPAWNPRLAAGLLRFYWFRMTDSFVPLATGIVLFGLASQRFAISVWMQRFAITALTACVLLLAVQYVNSLKYSVPDSYLVSVSTRPEQQEEDFRAWLEVCAWAATNTDSETIFITPRHQQTFKWYASRAEVVSWKDVPQDAKSLIEWAKRINKVYPREVRRRHPPLDTELLRELAREYAVGYVIIDRRMAPELLDLPIVYPEANPENTTFVVYQLSDSKIVIDGSLE